MVICLNFIANSKSIVNILIVHSSLAFTFTKELYHCGLRAPTNHALLWHIVHVVLTREYMHNHKHQGFNSWISTWRFCVKVVAWSSVRKVYATFCKDIPIVPLSLQFPIVLDPQPCLAPALRLPWTLISIEKHATSLAAFLALRYNLRIYAGILFSMNQR